VTYPDGIDVLEHGNEVSAGTGDPPAGLARLATTLEPIYSGYTLAIIDQSRSSLTHRGTHLVNVPSPYRTSDLWDEQDVRYCLLSALYRLNRIIDLYVEKCRLFEEHSPVGLSGNTSDPRIYYEIDAFLGDARRVYESIRKVLWRHYPTPGVNGHVEGLWLRFGDAGGARVADVTGELSVIMIDMCF
jgi:hypothetical protein